MDLANIHTNSMTCLSAIILRPRKLCDSLHSSCDSDHARTLAEWNNGVCGEREPALFVVKSALNIAFTAEGRLIMPLEFWVVGDVQRFVEALAASDLFAQASEDMVMLMPEEAR